MGFIKLNSKNEIKENVKWSPCRVYQINPITQRPVCYSVEALKYAQTGFFVGCVIAQFYNSIACKTTKNSFGDIGLRNFFMIFGWCSEFVLCLIVCYALPINYIFNTRDLILPHFMLPGIISCIICWVYDESRKYLIRNWPKDNPKYPNWFERNIMY